MTKKGSFWKGNIKKIKKERKERRIAEKVKISRMKIEKTVFNVLKSVVTDNEKKKQQKHLQKTKEVYLLQFVQAPVKLQSKQKHKQ